MIGCELCIILCKLPIIMRQAEQRKHILSFQITKIYPNNTKMISNDFQCTPLAALILSYAFFDEFVRFFCQRRDNFQFFAQLTKYPMNNAGIIVISECHFSNYDIP